MNYQEYLTSKNYSQQTIIEYTRELEKFKKFLYSHKKVSSELLLYNVMEHDVYNYLAYMSSIGNCVRTKRRALFALKIYYKWQCLDSTKDNPIKNIEIRNSRARKLPKVMNLEQSTKLINYYTDDRGLIIKLFLNTGLRLNELVNIKKGDIENGYITVLGKGNKTRQVYLPSKLYDELLIFAKNKPDKIFPGRRYIQYFVKKAMLDLNIEGSVHTLRHTFATMLYEQTHDILLVKEALGHDSIEATQIYTHINNTEIRRAVEANPLNES